MKQIGRWDHAGSYEQQIPTRSVTVKKAVAKEPPTEMISEAMLQGGLWLLYRGKGKEQDLRPTKYPYVIGKKEGQADGLLSANTVSRIHARIYREGDGYYLEDANSTNGTFVNGELLPCNTPYPLRQEDRILFGDEEYQVALLP